MTNDDDDDDDVEKSLFFEIKSASNTSSTNDCFIERPIFANV